MPEIRKIDVSPLFRAGGQSARVESEIAAAIRETGGFLIVAFPGAEKLDALARTALTFFNLDKEIKQALALKSRQPDGKQAYRGYLASLGEVDWAHNEYYDVGPEEPVRGPKIPGMEVLEERNAWPTVEPCPGWRQAVRALYLDLDKVAAVVMAATGRSAGFSDQDIATRFAGGNSTLRLLNYPKRSGATKVFDELPDDRAGADSTLSLAAGRHTDASGLSMLWQGQPGLQAQSPDGAWHDVPRIENSISVHLGDVLQNMTNGQVPATPHRVLDLGSARQSIGYFYEPALSARLTPLGENEIEDGGARGTYGWHLLRKLHTYEGNAAHIPFPE